MGHVTCNVCGIQGVYLHRIDTVTSMSNCPTQCPIRTQIPTNYLVENFTIA